MRLPHMLVLALASVLAAVPASPASADVVVDWNIIAGQTITAAGATRPGPSGLLDFAMVHEAIYDAVQAFDRRYQPC